MSEKKQKQFGVWLDAHHATIVGRENVDGESFVVLGHVKNTVPTGNSNENTKNNHERTLQQQFFKEIASYMQNVDEVHVSGTGDVQEQFIKFLSETPQYKNTIAKESTSANHGDEKFLEFVSAQFK